MRVKILLAIVYLLSFPLFPHAQYNWPMNVEVNVNVNFEEPPPYLPYYRHPQYPYYQPAPSTQWAPPYYPQPVGPTISSNPATHLPASVPPLQNLLPCGVSRLGIPLHRVMNGVESVKGDWPWLVYMSSGCTGSIISRRHVLSAAHCAFDGTMSAEIPIDQRNFTITDGANVLHSVKRALIHPDYSSSDFTSPDIAIYELAEEMTLGGQVDRICLPGIFKEHAGDVAHIVGYGARYGTGYGKKIAREQLIPLNDASRCVHYFKHPVEFDSRLFICGGGRWKGTEPGDSGGPLMMPRNGHWYQVGLTSFGVVGTDEMGIFDVGAYTRVAAHCDWIEKSTQGEVRCVSMD